MARLKKSKVEGEPKEANLVGVKQYTIRMEYFDNDTCKMTRTNDGLNVYELLGVLARSTEEVIMQIKGLMPPPDIIHRRVVLEENSPNQ